MIAWDAVMLDCVVPISGFGRFRSDRQCSGSLRMLYEGGKLNGVAFSSIYSRP
jgi:hypothetical protein